jgi:hypothetical protein
MSKAWDPHKPVETLFKHIHDCDDYAEAGGVTVGHVYQINVAYAKIFSTGSFTGTYQRWNEKEPT